MTKPVFDEAITLSALTDYVNVVFDPEDIVEIRYIANSLKPFSEWSPAYALKEAIPNILKHNQQGYNIYVGIGPREASGDRTSDKVALHRCLVADFDKVDLRTVRDHLLHADVPAPTLLVATGNGFHAYWRLSEPILKGQGWSDYQRGIIAALEEIADQRIKDNARILRVPGTFNTKNMANLLLCEIIEYHPENVYDLDLFVPITNELPNASEVELPEGKLDLHPSTLRKLKQFPQAANWNSTIFEVAVDFAGRNWNKRDCITLIEASAQPKDKDNRRMMLATIDSAYSKKRIPVGWGSDSDEDYIEFTLNQQIKGGDLSSRLKAKEKGEQPLPVVKNVIVLDDDKRYFVTAAQIHRNVSEGTKGWPRRMSGELFIIHEDRIKFLKDTKQFFGWLHRVSHLYWPPITSKVLDPRTKDYRTPITKSEFFEYLRTEQDDYFGYEELPHEPPLEHTFYVPIDLPESDGTALAEFIDHLNPDTEEDKNLLLAMLMTPAAGLPPGMRPAFILISDYGRGVGKTTTADLVASVYGGAITVNEGEDWEKVRARLLDDEAAGYRVVVIDNIRKRLASSGLESAITATWMDGKKMYVGQSRRRNDITWIFTANNPALSTDLADRGVPIRIGDVKHATDFAHWRLNFLKEKRLMLLSDILALLKSEPVCEIDTDNKDRWSLWQQAILTRIEGGNELAALIRTRRPELDDDKDLSSEILEHVESWLHRVHEDYHQLRFKIKSFDLMRLLTSGVHLLSRKENDSTRRFVPYLRQLCALPPLQGKLHYSKRYHAFVYTGKDSGAKSKLIEFDAEETE